MIARGVSAQEKSKYQLELKGETFVPEANINSVLSNPESFFSSEFNGAYYVAIQFNELPSGIVRMQLESRKVKLLDYITGNTYLVKLESKADLQVLAENGARALFYLDKQHKIERQLLEKKYPSWALYSKSVIDLVVIPYEWFETSRILSSLESLDAEILESEKLFRSHKIRIPINRIDDLAGLAWVQWIEAIPPAPVDDNVPGKTLHRSNILNDGSRNLTGANVRMGIWDGGTVGPHKDFTGRLTNGEGYYLSSDHGTHVAGTMAGAGLLDPVARGMAPGALIYSYDYNGSVNVEVAAAIAAYNITMTQNSWGYGDGFVNCTQRDPYNSNSREQDINIYNNPTLIHCHSAGNSQSVCSGGWGTTTGKAAKNKLVVANVNSSDAISSSSSFGPVQDGRLKPEISGLGTSVYSTLPNDAYTGGYSGTSMATPGVSGTIAQLVERYRQLNSGIDPQASLMKAIACNTARDLGNAGPDYRFGYGRINGLHAVRAIEQNRFRVDSVATADSNLVSITVPSGTSRMKVMICWTDPPASANANPALVNDLDLTLYDPSSTAWLPWVLNPASPTSTATRNVDRLNNIEQVTLNNPVAGTYNISVKGFSVSTGLKQIYSLTWEIEPASIEITYPNGGEVLVPGSTEVIYWDNLGVTSNQTVQYSLNNGSSWITLSSSVTAATNRYSWTVPSTVSSQVLVRVTSGALSDVSDNVFNILGTPSNLAVTNGCSAGEVQVSWNAVSSASGYDVLLLDDTIGVWNTVGTNISGTSHTITGLMPYATYWVTVRALNAANSITGRRAIAKSVSTTIPSSNPIINVSGQTTICATGDTAHFSAGNVPANTYSLSGIPYDPYTITTDTPVTLSDDAVSASLPIGFTFNYYGTPYTNFFIGSNGIIGFSSTSMTAYQPQTLPNSAAPNNIIALVWTDLNPSTGGTIAYNTIGLPPNRKLVVSFEAVRRYNSTATVSGRIELYEGSDIIEIHVSSISSGINTMGIENQSGSSAVPVPGRNNSTWSVGAPEAFRFSPFNSTITWQPGAINAPAISVTVPGSYSYSYVSGTCTLYSDTVVVSGCSNASLNLTVLIDGYYRGGGKLVSLLSASQCDTLVVSLANVISPYEITHTVTGIIDTSGNGIFDFPGSTIGSAYYLVINHRNSLETWSAVPVTFLASPVTYDFSSNISSAFAGNMIDFGDGRYGIYSGDVNQDDIIDMNDHALLESFILTQAAGYHNGDVTGDDNVESSDYSLLENRIPMNLITQRP